MSFRMQVAQLRKNDRKRYDAFRFFKHRATTVTLIIADFLCNVHCFYCVLYCKSCILNRYL